MSTPSRDVLVSALSTLARVNRLARTGIEPSELLHQVCAEVRAGLGSQSVWALLHGEEAAELLGRTKDWVPSSDGGAALFVSGSDHCCHDVILQILRAGSLPACCRTSLAAGAVEVVASPVSRCSGCCQQLSCGAIPRVAIPLRNGSVVFGVLTLSIDGDVEGLLGMEEHLRDLGEVVGSVLGRALLEQRSASLRCDSELLFSSTEDALIAVDRNGGIVQANRRFWDLAGITGARRLEDLPESLRSILQACLASDPTTSHHSQVQLALPGERVVPVEVTSPPLASSELTTRWCILRDLSQRVDARNRFEILFHRSPSPMALTDGTTGRLREVNAAFTEVTGCSRAEVLGHTTAELGIFVDEAQHRQAVSTLRETGVLAHTELTLRRRDGTHRIGRFSGGVIPGPSGPEFFTVMEDVTDVRQTAEAMKESLRYFQQLYRDSPVPMFLHDPETGALRDANRRGWEIYGCRSLEELHDYDCWLEPPYSFNEAMGLMRQALETGSAEVLWKARRVDGRLIWAQVHLSCLNVCGEEAVLVAFLDVTGREVALQKLTESDQRYADLVRLLGGFSWEVDLHGTYTYVGPTIRDFLGWTPEEVVGRLTCFDLLPPSEREQVAVAAIDMMARGEHFSSFENTLLRRDGSPVTVATHGFPLLDDSGAVRGYRGIDLDITARKAMEDEHRRTAARAQNQRTALTQLVSRRSTNGGLHKSFTELVTETLAQTLEASRASIWELTAGGATLHCVDLYLSSENVHRHGERIQTCEFPEYFAAVEAEGCLAVVDARTDPRTSGLMQGYTLPSGIVSMLDAGIFLEGRLVGIVCVESVGAARNWFPDEESFATTLATMVSQHRAESRTRDAEERLRLALRSANQGIYDLDLRTGEAVVSSEYASMLGYDPATFHETNQKWLERLHPQDAPKASRSYHEYVAGIVPEYRAEFRQRTASGGWLWILSCGSAVEWDEAGNPVRMVGTHTDISRLKELEYNLREREKESRCLFEVGRALRSGRAQEPLPLRECVESTVRALTVPEAMRVEIHFGNREFVAGDPNATTLLASIEIPGTPGASGRLLVMASEVSQVEGTPSLLAEKVSMLEEVARLVAKEARTRTADQELIEKQTLLANAEAIANVGSWILDVAEDRLRWSDQVYAIFGINRSDFGATYEAFIEAIHPEDRAAVSQAYESSLASGAPGYEIRHRIVRRDDGRIRHVHERCIHTRRDGRVVQSIGTVQDVTEEAEATERIIYEGAMRVLLQEAATLLAGAPIAESKEAVDTALGKLGSFANADRAYVIRLNWDTGRAHNTHEWCAPGVAPIIDQLRDVPIDEARKLVESISSGKHRWIPSVAALEDESERRFLEAQAIRSLLMMPMMEAGSCAGVVGFDWVQQGHRLLGSEVEMLSVFSSLLSTHFGRVAAGRSLEESERQHRLLFASMTQGVVVQDETGTIIDCNRSAELILDLTRDEILGRTSRDARWKAIREDGTPFPGEEHPAMVALRTGVPCLGVIMGLAYSKQTRWIRINATPADEGDRSRVVFVTFDDITTERASEAAIRLLATQVEQAPFGIVRTSKDRQIEWVNKAFTRLTGYTMDEVLGRKPGTFLQGPDTSEEAVLRMRHALNNCEPVNVEVLNYNKSGTPYWIELTISPLFSASGVHNGFVGFARDVSERINAQRSLREATDRLSMLNDNLERLVEERTEEVRRQAAALESSFEGIAMYQRGRCIYRNAAHKRLFGSGSGDAGWQELIRPADARGTLWADRAAGTRMLEARAVGADGSEIDLEVDVLPLADEVEVLVARDVTERRRAQQKLEERELRYRALMEGAGDAILTATLDGRLIEANQKAEAFLGYTRMELESMHMTQLHRPQDLSLATAHFAGIIERGMAMAQDIPMLRKDGHIIYADVTGSVLKIGNETVVQGIFRDATVRRETELRLRELTDQLEMSLQSGKIGCWSYDVPAQTLKWDRRMFDLYGKSPESFTGRYDEWSSSLAPEDRERAEKELGDAVASGETFDTRFSILTPLGARRTIQARSIFQRNEAGVVTRVVGINYDITDMIQREQALQQLNRQLAEATRQKDEFLANMSHELRTPLNAILGMSEALAMGVYGEMTPRQLESLKRVEDSGRHLLSLINDILDLAKIEAGRIVLEPEVVTVRDLVTSMGRLMEEGAKAKGIVLQTEVDPTVTEIMADPRRLRQILLNLLSNALKFTAAGGRVRLLARPDSRRNLLHLEVSDTGEGIPPEKLGQLFKPFTQLESTLTKRHAGTGLGLSIVKRLAEMHGGSVVVESQPGIGSTFRVSLPYDRNATSSTDIPRGAGMPPPEEPSRRRSRTVAPILIVEDNESNTMIVRDFLVSAGYAVEVATNGAEAVRRAADNEYALILMDVQMPEMDGLEATRRIRRISGREHTPIIALTSFAMPGDRERCLNAGMTDYMSKPVSLRALMMTIKNLIRLSKG